MALPTITGTVTRRITLRHTSADSDKQYVITITHENGAALVFTEYGPSTKLIGGRCETPSAVSFLSATSTAENLRESKINHRKTPYRVVADDYFSGQADAAPSQPAQTTPKATAAPQRRVTTKPGSALSQVLLNRLI